jgi:hypothetical protein
MERSLSRRKPSDLFVVHHYFAVFQHHVIHVIKGIFFAFFVGPFLNIPKGNPGVFFIRIVGGHPRIKSFCYGYHLATYLAKDICQAVFLAFEIELIANKFDGIRKVFWAVGVRTFNYEGHAKGKDKQREGTDYNHNDRSINQLWPGFVAGEWHNNHHLFPKSARSGFKPHQVDLAWYYIKFMNWLGAVNHYKDNKQQFYERYYLPGRLEKAGK